MDQQVLQDMIMAYNLYESARKRVTQQRHTLLMQLQGALSESTGGGDARCVQKRMHWLAALFVHFLGWQTDASKLAVLQGAEHAGVQRQGRQALAIHPIALPMTGRHASGAGCMAPSVLIAVWLSDTDSGCELCLLQVQSRHAVSRHTQRAVPLHARVHPDVAELDRQQLT
jgi:hypothetical protein